MRTHTFKGTDDGADMYRRWWHFYAETDDGPCKRCGGSGFPSTSALGIRLTPDQAETLLRDTGAEDADVEHLRCEACVVRPGRRIEDTSVGAISLEATTNRHGFCQIGVTFNDDEDDVKLAFAIPKVVSLWLGLEVEAIKWPGFLGYGPHEFEVKAQSGTIRLQLGTDPHGAASNRTSYRRRYPHEWLRDVRATGKIGREERHDYRRKVDPKSLYGRYLRWRGFLPEHGFELVVLRYDWRDKLLGRNEQLRVEPVSELRGVEVGPIDPHWVDVAGERIMTLGGPRRPHVRSVVAMPEGNYPCLVALERITWGRRRWKWSHTTATHADVEMLVPVPEPGKGENSWDCDDDATYSLSGRFPDVASATAAVASHALQRRERYAGPAWEPSKGWPEGIVR